MKKILSYSLVAVLLLAGKMASAADSSSSVAGGFEMSGNVDVVMGYAHATKNASAGTNVGSAIGEFFGNNGGGGSDRFETVIDQVELDISKSFGENIRARADIDFAAFPESIGAPSQNGAAVNLEQAYVTVNLGVGKGAELLFGKFNAPIGVDPVDRNELLTVSHNNLFNYITPTNITGAKLYYAFTDVVDLNLYVVNRLDGGNLNNLGVGYAVNPFNQNGDSALPSVGGRLGFSWGEAGQKSTVGISAAAGPEQPGLNKHFDFLGDLDASIQVTDALLVALEGVYRQSNLTDADRLTGATKNLKIFGGMLLLNYKFSEVVDGTFRYDYVYQVNPPTHAFGLNMDGQVHDITLALGYQITDGAKFKVEYRFEYADPAGANDNNFSVHSVAGNFAYSF